LILEINEESYLAILTGRKSSAFDTSMDHLISNWIRYGTGASKVNKVGFRVSILHMGTKAILLYTLSPVVMLLCTSLPTVTFAQTSQTANSSGTTATTNTNITSTSGAGGPQLLKKIEKIPSLSNIIVLSLVDGIKVSGVNIGDTDLTLTLKRQTAGTNLTSPGNTSSLPVTVLVTKLPVNNLTQLISTAESTIQLAQASRNSDSTNSIVGGQSLGGAGVSGAAGSNALDILNLLKDVQIGTASIVIL
jgi:hypothetical protein